MKIFLTGDTGFIGHPHAHYRQNDNPWTDLLDVIPEIELAPLISAIVKMKCNEAILTRPELSAYYHLNGCVRPGDNSGVKRQPAPTAMAVG